MQQVYTGTIAVAWAEQWSIASPQYRSSYETRLYNQTVQDLFPTVDDSSRNQWKECFHRAVNSRLALLSIYKKVCISSHSRSILISQVGYGLYLVPWRHFNAPWGLTTTPPQNDYIQMLFDNLDDRSIQRLEGKKDNSRRFCELVVKVMISQRLWRHMQEILQTVPGRFT